jgi:uncharacterized protein (DUF2236 family)
MLAAEMLGLPRRLIPPTVQALEDHIEAVASSGELQVTHAARKIAGLFLDPPRDAQWRPILRLVARLAFGTLPSSIRREYGVPSGPLRRASVASIVTAMRVARPALPPRFRFIAPYQARRRGRGSGTTDPLDAIRRSLGLRLG